MIYRQRPKVSCLFGSHLVSPGFPGSFHNNHGLLLSGRSENEEEKLVRAGKLSDSLSLLWHHS